MEGEAVAAAAAAAAMVEKGMRFITKLHHKKKFW